MGPVCAWLVNMRLKRQGIRDGSSPLCATLPLGLASHVMCSGLKGPEQAGDSHVAVRLPIRASEPKKAGSDVTGMGALDILKAC